MKWIYMMMIALVFTACRDDDCVQDGFTDEEQQEELERVPVQLGISIGNYSTYSTIETDDKTPHEIGDIKDVDLYIFRENGDFFESHLNIPLEQNAVNTNLYETGVFELAKGNWYIYAFTHTPDNLIQQPTQGTTIIDFEKQRVGVKGGLTHMTFMGTLVRELKTITGTGNPEVIFLKVGHLVSKVSVTPGIPEIAGDLKGKFESMNNTLTKEVSFNISCKPNGMHLVGQWEGDYMGEWSQLISPHYASYNISQHFVSPLYEYPSNGLGYWYTIENSNQKPNIENTSFFVLGFIYKPHQDEIHSSNHTISGDTLINKTFYVAEFPDGSKLIYAQEPPIGDIHPERGEIKRVRSYGKGMCYYRVPIEDTSKQTMSQRYSVIRNHHYVLTINSISGFGSDNETDWDDWEEPWEEEAQMEATLEVIDWVPYDIPVDLDGK